MAKQLEPIGEPRRLYVVQLRAYMEAIVIARGRDRVEKALYVPNWTEDHDGFEITKIEEVANTAGLPPRDYCTPDSEQIEDVPDGSWDKLLAVLAEEQRQAKIEADFRAKQILLLDSTAPGR